MGYVTDLLARRVDPETGTINPMALYSVRKDITDAMAGKLSGDLANLRLARGQLNDLLPVIDATIESGAPGFNQYMQQFAKSSRPIDQMRLLQSIESKVTTGQPNLMTGDTVLAASALRQGGVQQVAAVIAPKLLGGLAARTPLGDLGLEDLDQVQSWRELERRALGSDLLWELENPEPPADHAGLTTMGAGIGRPGSAR
jgi:hypothetical protein